MTTYEYEKPWQVMPAKIIKLALEHTQKDSDFDHQVAYLLLDIGVETALKVYLVNKKQEVEKIVFPDLLKRVKEELSKDKPALIRHLDDISYLHGIRNKLYHQGDGVRPTKDNLKRYSSIAKQIVQEVLQVNLETAEKEYRVALKTDGYAHKFEELSQDIKVRFEYFQESCAIIAEKLRPNYGTREFALRLKWILENYPDNEEDNPHNRIKNEAMRLEKFNELTGKESKDQGFVDFVLEDINLLYVTITLQEISDNRQEDWAMYINILENRDRLLSNWKQDICLERLSIDQVRGEYQKIISWLESQQKKLDQWIDSHMENISRGHSGIGLFEAV